MGRRLYLCDWCEDHHYREMPHPPDQPPDDDPSYDEHMEKCQCWCAT